MGYPDGQDQSPVGQLRFMQYVYGEILRGKKPTIDVDAIIPFLGENGNSGKSGPTPDHHYDGKQRTFHLLQHMDENSCLSEQPGTYVDLRVNGIAGFGAEKNTKDGVEPIVKERITNYHPIASSVITSILSLKNHLGDYAHSKHVAVLGDPESEHLLTQSPIDYQALNAVVVPEMGNIQMAEQLTRILADKLENKPGTEQLAIIFSNRASIGFWRPVIAALGKDYGQWLARSTGDKVPHSDAWSDQQHNMREIIGCNSYDEIAPLLTKHLPSRLDQRTTEDGYIKPGATMLVATKTRDKIHELRHQFEGTNIRILPLDVIANFKNPKEISGTYAANAKEKIDEGIEALIQQIGDKPGAFTDDLKEAGIDPNNLYLLAEDSGLHLEDERILEHMDLSNLGLKPGYVFNAKHFPGVEFGPAINSALGESAFWDEVNKVNQQLADTVGAPAMPEAHSTSVLALRKIALNPEYKAGAKGSPIDADEAIKFFSAMTNDTIADKPCPATTVPTSFHYQVPTGQHPIARSDMDPDNPTGHLQFAPHKTRAQMSWDEWFKYSPRGEAARTLMQATGMIENGKLKDAFHADSVPSIRKSAKQPYRIGVFGEDKQKAARIEDATNTALPLKKLGATDDWNKKVTHLSANADAFVLMPRDHTVPSEQDPQFFDQLFTFFSAIVARQIHPRDIDKPFIVYNHNNCWGDLLELYDHMRNNAMVFDQSRLLLNEVSSMEELQTALEKGQRNNFISTHEERDQGPMTINESGRFNVAVFCSATARNETLNNDAKQLGTFLGENNFGLVYGAGDREMMGSVYDGMREVRNASGGQKGWIAASSSDHILEVEADHPETFKQPLGKDNPNGVNQYYDAANIYERIEYMVKTSDAFAVIPGGAGTVQELAAILMMKEAGHPSMKGKHIVVMSKMNIGGQEIDFYGPLLRHIPKERLKALDVHVVDSMQQAQEKLDEVRNEAMQTQPKNTITEVGQYYKHDGHILVPHQLQ